ncbi:NAD(P)/FAD-dependent oxidoreductase [Thalassolituus oleivorans]|jgi:hypothetical protein|uniref:Putative NAD/FAD-dependent oxidoreductase n=1 Tax=Thalassolituus oleivorans MIL-1 TaxID=1298593 RepID=M5DTG8_9GAMM|nr:FAD-dependent oxidoreductase [Thalassolituus oleivorans]CCU73201.1 putative NAD/FAD-dependent oxidoreductase [Thalassolituus oleivorans MIL-1]
MKRIAIVGAGMAGLSALSALTKQGHVVTLFDKSRGSGGRMASKKVGDASWDMGAQFIRAHDASFMKTLHEWQHQGWVSEWAVTPHVIDAEGIRLSDDESTRYVGVSRMTALSRQLLAPATEFIPNTRIVSCQRTDSEWLLTDENDQHYGPFDSLIINTPPQQALPLLENSHLAAAINDVEMLPCWTLLLAFPERIDTPVDAAFVHDSAIAWLARNNSKPLRDSGETWVIQASHAWSQEQVDAPREEVLHALEQAFFTALGVQGYAVSEHWLHRWLYAVPAKPLDAGALFDADRAVAVCGDWCQRGTLEGAWLSGQQAASYF